MQYPSENAALLCLGHCNRFSHYCASLAERKKERKKEEDRRYGRLATCRCGTPAMVSSNVNDLVTDENTRE